MQTIIDDINPEVKFAGFVSDIKTMQENGWGFSVQEMCSPIRHYDFRLAMKHEGANLYGLTNLVSIPRNEILSLINSLSFNVICMGSSNISIMHHVPNFDPKAFFPFNAFDPNSTIKIENFSLQDLRFFKPAQDNSPEIVIAKENINELMDRILKMQDSKAIEIREKRRKEALRKEFSESGTSSFNDIACKIISLGA